MNYSEIESKRFGLRVVRGQVERLDLDALLLEIDTLRADVAMVRVPVTKQYTIPSLEALGIPCICADTLVSYKCNLASYEPQPLRNPHLEYVRCDESHHAELDALVDKCFKNYTNHYYSNPVLDKSDILSGYKEWARTYAMGNGPSQKCWIVRRAEKILGFATCHFDGTKCEGVLYCVVPEASGIGLYSDLIRFTQSHFKSAGFRMMTVSSQIQNYTVQKVWALEGFRLAGAEVTLHLNAFLGDRETQWFDFSFREESSWDLDLRTILASHFPSVLVKGMRCRAIRDIDSSVKYAVGVSFPGGDGLRSVVQVRNSSSRELCALAFFELGNKKL